MILKKERVDGKIYCCDIFNAPDNLINKFDVVVSLGLIEHFENTTHVVQALAKFLKPGGIVLTIIPNLTRLMGALQKRLDKKVYDLHVPLDKDNMESAHKAAGLEIIDCDYFLSINFAVLNINLIKKYSFQWWLKKIILNFFIFISLLVWEFESVFSIKLKSSAVFSPYIICVAKKK